MDIASFLRERSAPDGAVLSQTNDFERLDEALRLAPAASPNLFDQVREHFARPSLRQAGRTTEIDGMIEAAAWTDAAIALIDVELPNWSVRRLVCEDGEWLCSLSRHPHVPMFLDKPVERNHRVLALAILRAFVAARFKSVATYRVTSSVPQVGVRPAYVFCCDNFA
jgi:hypothetical protein